MRPLTYIALSLFSVIASGCGGDSDGPSAPAPQPFNQTITGTVSNFGFTQHPLTTPRAGNMTLTLSWQTSADLDLYLTSGTCNAYPPDNCQMLAQSDRTVGSSETIARTVASGEAFKVWVDNFTFAPQNYSLTIVIQ